MYKTPLCFRLAGLFFLLSLSMSIKHRTIVCTKYRIDILTEGFIFGWRAFSSVSLCESMFTARDGRKGPPAGNKARCEHAT
jgi:hypothetical protein